MRPYSLAYTPRAARDIAALDRVAQKRLAVKLLELQANPIGRSRKLVHSAIGSYRYRVGDYRVVFDLSGAVIVVLRVGHRKDIYK